MVSSVSTAAVASPLGENMRQNTKQNSTTAVEFRTAIRGTGSFYSSNRCIAAQSAIHFFAAFVDSSISTPPPPLPTMSPLVAPSTAVWRRQLLFTPFPVSPRHETFRRFDDPSIPLPTLRSGGGTLRSRGGPKHRLYRERRRRAFRGSLGGSKPVEAVC